MTTQILIFSRAALFLTIDLEANSNINLAKYQTVRSSSNRGDWPAQFANDGLVTEDSRWRSLDTNPGPHWLEIELAVPMTIGSAHLFSGGTFDSPTANFDLQYLDGNT